jgi:superfamily II DNA or RNA helicase
MPTYSDQDLARLARQDPAKFMRVMSQISGARPNISPQSSSPSRVDTEIKHVGNYIKLLNRPSLQIQGLCPACRCDITQGKQRCVGKECSKEGRSTHSSPDSTQCPLQATFSSHPEFGHQIVEPRLYIEVPRTVFETTGVDTVNPILDGIVEGADDVKEMMQPLRKKAVQDVPIPAGLDHVQWGWSKYQDVSMPHVKIANGGTSQVSTELRTEVARMAKRAFERCLLYLNNVNTTDRTLNPLDRQSKRRDRSSEALKSLVLALIGSLAYGGEDWRLEHVSPSAGIVIGLKENSESVYIALDFDKMTKAQCTIVAAISAWRNQANAQAEKKSSNRRGDEVGRFDRRTAPVFARAKRNDGSGYRKHLAQGVGLTPNYARFALIVQDRQIFKDRAAVTQAYLMQRKGEMAIAERVTAARGSGGPMVPSVIRVSNGQSGARPTRFTLTDAKKQLESCKDKLGAPLSRLWLKVTGDLERKCRRPGCAPAEAQRAERLIVRAFAVAAALLGRENPAAASGAPKDSPNLIQRAVLTAADKIKATGMSDTLAELLREFICFRPCVDKKQTPARSFTNPHVGEEGMKVFVRQIDECDQQKIRSKSYLALHIESDANLLEKHASIPCKKTKRRQASKVVQLGITIGPGGTVQAGVQPAVPCVQPVKRKKARLLRRAYDEQPELDVLFATAIKLLPKEVGGTAPRGSWDKVAEAKKLLIKAAGFGRDDAGSDDNARLFIAGSRLSLSRDLRKKLLTGRLNITRKDAKEMRRTILVKIPTAQAVAAPGFNAALPVAQGFQFGGRPTSAEAKKILNLCRWENNSAVKMADLLGKKSKALDKALGKLKKNCVTRDQQQKLRMYILDVEQGKVPSASPSPTTSPAPHRSPSPKSGPSRAPSRASPKAGPRPPRRRPAPSAAELLAEVRPSSTTTLAPRRPPAALPRLMAAPLTSAEAGWNKEYGTTYEEEVRRKDNEKAAATERVSSTDRQRIAQAAQVAAQSHNMPRYQRRGYPMSRARDKYNNAFRGNWDNLSRSAQQEYYEDNFKLNPYLTAITKFDSRRPSHRHTVFDPYAPKESVRPPPRAPSPRAPGVGLRRVSPDRLNEQTTQEARPRRQRSNQSDSDASPLSPDAIPLSPLAEGKRSMKRRVQDLKKGSAERAAEDQVMVYVQHMTGRRVVGSVATALRKYAVELQHEFCRNDDGVVQCGPLNQVRQHVGDYTQNVSLSSLRDYQKKATNSFFSVRKKFTRERDKMIAYDIEFLKSGLLVSPTGSGKTLMALQIILRAGLPVLILTPSAETLLQFEQILKVRKIMTATLSDESNVIDVVTKPAVLLTYTALEALQRSPKSEANLKRLIIFNKIFPLVILDEVHRLKDDQQRWLHAVQELRGLSFIGLTGTSFRHDVEWTGLPDLLGSFRHEVDKKKLIAAGWLPRILCYFHKFPAARPGVLDMGKVLVLVNILREKSSEKTLVTCTCLKTLEQFHEAAQRRLGKKLLIVTGDTDKYPEDVRWTTIQRFRGQSNVLFISNIGDVGLDVPATCHIVLAPTSASKVQLFQRLGRIMRPKDRKHPNPNQKPHESHTFASPGREYQLTEEYKHDLRAEPGITIRPDITEL